MAAFHFLFSHLILQWSRCALFSGQSHSEDAKADTKLHDPYQTICFHYWCVYACVRCPFSLRHTAPHWSIHNEAYAVYMSGQTAYFYTFTTWQAETSAPCRKHELQVFWVSKSLMDTQKAVTEVWTFAHAMMEHIENELVLRVSWGTMQTLKVQKTPLELLQQGSGRSNKANSSRKRTASGEKGVPRKMYCYERSCEWSLFHEMGKIGNEQKSRFKRRAEVGKEQWGGQRKRTPAQMGHEPIKVGGCDRIHPVLPSSVLLSVGPGSAMLLNVTPLARFTFAAGWQPFITGRRFSYAAPLPRNHLRGIPITSGLIDVRFIKVNEPTGHLLSSWSSTGDNGWRRGGRRATERQPGQIQIQIGEIKLETKRSHSCPLFFSSSPCNQRGALPSIPVFSHSPIHLAFLFMAFIFQVYDSIYGGYIYGIWLTALSSAQCVQ